MDTYAAAAYCDPEIVKVCVFVVGENVCSQFASVKAWSCAVCQNSTVPIPTPTFLGFVTNNSSFDVMVEILFSVDSSTFCQ